MNRPHSSGPQAILSLAGLAEDGRVDRGQYSKHIEPEPWVGRSSSAKVDESDILKILVSGLTHDINNMLHVSVSAIELVQDRIDRGKMEEISDLSKIALMSLRRASAMAHDFLSFTQPVRVDSKRICVNAIVASMAPLLRCTLGDEIKVKLVLAEGLSLIVCNGERLESAVLNMAINARDAMPFGGTITITTFNTEPGDKHPGVEHRRGIGIRVTDNGEGMAPYVLQRAFDPFYSTKSRGTGLGLAMIKSFVEGFRGKVSATSSVDHGTSLELYFPVV